MPVTRIPAFDGLVTVIGDVMLDRYWSGPCSRISPEAPVPVVRISHHEDRVGGAANVAINITALGAPCNLVGIVGEDDAAAKLRQLVEEKNVTANFISSSSVPTITKLRILSRNQQLLRVDFEEQGAGIDHGRMMQAVRQSIRNSRVIICSDYGKGALSSIRQIIKAAHDREIPVLIDPKGTDFDRYRGAYLLTPNLSEFEAVAGKVADEEDLVKKALKMIADYELTALLVTRSEEGMSLIRPGMEPVHLPTRAREVYDVTGAGDTVIAAVAACLATGLSLQAACEIANTAAGIVVGKLGTSTASPEEINEELSGQHNKLGGVVTQQELLNIVRQLKSRGKRIVMTNGCFDLLHQGHVDYLQQARDLGDVLIVAVNSDSSVKQLKGPSRPIVPEENRMALLAALSCVDLVVPFDEETPQRLISEVLPDILVKGGDYKVEEIAGHEEVQAAGGRVVILPFTPGFSTTSIVNRIKER